MIDWECDKCGRCCEIVGEKYGEHCPSYDMNTKLCKIYDTRPDICRTAVTEDNSKFYKEYCNSLKGGD